jgi:hypothetical protein
VAFRPRFGTKSFRGFPEFDSFTRNSDFLYHTAGAADTLNKYPTDIIKNPILNISGFAPKEYIVEIGSPNAEGISIL